MSVLLDDKSRVVVQGITGREGTFHTRKCVEYAKECGTASGTVVAGVTPGKGGTDMDGIPVFHSVADAVKGEGVDVSLIFVPPPFAADAVLEAAEAGIRLIITITEGIPVLDMLRVNEYLKKTGARMVGPNCPGVISPGKAKAGIMPGQIHKPGPIGVVSRSGTLTYEAVGQLTRLDLGQSTCIGIGGDPIIGTTFVDALGLFESDPATEGIVMIGEIGGSAEEEAAAFIKEHVGKPVAAFIAGRTAPPGRRMGHAGAIISGGKGGAGDKVAALEAAGIRVAALPSEIGRTMKEALAG